MDALLARPGPAPRQDDGVPSGAGAFDPLYRNAYETLRQLAHRRLRSREPLTLLDTTALVHEAYLRCQADSEPVFPSHGHFLAYAAQVMRSVIVDAIRRRRAQRRGGAQVHHSLNTSVAEQVASCDDDVIRISEALDELAQVDARAARVVEMRFFAGLQERDIAQALGIDERTVRRDWKKARLLLSAALAGCR